MGTIKFDIGTSTHDRIPDLIEDASDMVFPYVFGQDVKRDYANVSFTIERITPDVAYRMMQGVTPPNKSKVERIRDSIESGKWMLNGATIAISSSGAIKDGRARLLACHEANIPIDSVVVRGVGDDVDVTVGLGKPRSAADQLQIMGIPDAKNVATIARALYFSDEIGHEGYLRGESRHLTVSNSALIDYAMPIYNERIKPVLLLVSKIKLPGLRKNTLGVLFDKIRSHSEAELEAFVGQLSRATPPCASVNTLIVALDKNAKKHSEKSSQYTIAAWVVKTWNAFIQGNELKVLSFRQGGSCPESFPAIMKGGD